MVIKFRQNFVVADHHHPVCAAKDAAQLFVDRAATLLGEEGNMPKRQTIGLSEIETPCAF